MSLPPFFVNAVSRVPFNTYQKQTNAVPMPLSFKMLATLYSTPMNARYQGQVQTTIHQAPPMMIKQIKTVKIAAPALSAVVTGSACRSPGPMSLVVPALGLPLLVPPDPSVTGPSETVIRFDCMTSNADICSPTPVLPSNDPVVHCRPHDVPLSPPVHDAAAACADVSSMGFN